MDLWRPATLGHQILPGIWGYNSPNGQESQALGDLQQVPASVQVYNACIYDKLRLRSDDCGLGLAHSAYDLNAFKNCGSSLREYANRRVEHEQFVDEKIKSATDISRLWWEAQMAHMAKQYILAAVLLRRAAEFDSPDACAMLAKMFGFGIQKSNLALFERDTLRGIAWAIRAIQLLSFDVELDASSFQALQLMCQTLKLLCTLVCAPESLQSLGAVNHNAEVSMSLLLLFPRSCELLHPKARIKDVIPTEFTRESIWSALRDVLCKVKAVQSSLKEEEPGDAASLEHELTFIRLHTLFLESFLLMRTALVEKEAAYMQETYHAWTLYLNETRECTDCVTFSQFRTVASEIQQWAAPDSERTLAYTLSDAETSAMCHRIASVFTFMRTKPHEPKAAVPAVQHQLRLKRSRRDLRAPANDSLRIPLSKPQHLARITPSNASSAPSKDHAMSHTTQRYSGSSSVKLRDMSNIVNRRFLSADHASTLGNASDQDEAPYWSRMGDKVGKLRRRPSSVFSVTPSLMFPSKSEAETTASDGGHADANQEQVHARPNLIVSSSSDANRLRSSLRRQSSRASLNTEYVQE